MRIICLSHNAPPLNNAEALCTARLLTSLVESGVEVHLVAAETEASLDPTITSELMHPEIRTTYVAKPGSRVGRFASMARHLFHGESVEWISKAATETRRLLREMPGSILMSRAFPMASNIAAWYCRRDAKAWVAHFSDPYPPHEWKNHWYSPLLRPVNYRWARRLVNDADLVTVTCPNAARYIEEKTDVSLENKCHVLRHLALPKLQPGAFKLDRRKGDFVVAHIGNLMQRRRPDLLLKGVLLAMEKQPAIRFLQYGHIDPEILKWCRASPAAARLEMRRIDNLDPRESGELQQQVDVNVIVDTDLGLPYSPFILSKYPHSVCAGKPLLMLSSPDSDMARFTELHGCGEVVPFSASPDDVAAAILKLYEHRLEPPPAEAWENYQAEFGAERIVTPFIERISNY